MKIATRDLFLDAIVIFIVIRAYDFCARKLERFCLDRIVKNHINSIGPK